MRARSAPVALLFVLVGTAGRPALADVVIPYNESLFAPIVDRGAFISYGPDLTGLFVRASTYVDRILSGASPAALPIEQPTTFALVINLKTAQALGIAVPPAFVARADRVIE